MALYELLSWMSPAFPIGAFSHSGGLEWAVEAGLVTDQASTQAWIADSLTMGAAWNDCVMFVFAHRAVRAGDCKALAEIAELSVAAQSSLERRTESTAQGAAFRRIASVSASAPGFDMIAGIEDQELAYPIAAASLMAAHNLDLREGLIAFLHGYVSNQVSAAQRLVPLGQTAAQHVIAALRTAVLQTAEEAAALCGDPFDALRGGAISADIACMAHETQYTRLFRT